MELFKEWILGVNDFPARWVCGNWTQPHGWVHIISDILVWGAYMAIPVILIYFVRKRRDLPFPKILWLFAAFIFACGTGHLIEAIIYWVPIYRIAALNKVLTATVSWATVLVLFPIVPFILTLKSPKELQLEVERRKEAELTLTHKAGQLEEMNHELKKKHDLLINQNKEIERMNKSMVGRENRMVELKQTIKQLQEKLDQSS